MYKPRHFRVVELVDPEIYKMIGEKALLLLDPDLLLAADLLRDDYGPIIINNWSNGGQYRESGLRRLDTRTGAPLSAHKAGRAFDLKFANHTPAEVLAAIVANPARYPIRRVEDPRFTPTWLHIDTVPHSGSGVRVFTP